MPNIGDFERANATGEDAINAFASGADIGSMAPKQSEKEKKPKTNAETAKTETETTETAENQENRAGELEGLLTKFEQSPELSYEKKLEQHGITMNDAMNIVSSVIDNNFYEKEYPITKSHSVTFRTRLTSHQDTFLKNIEERNPRYAPTIAHELSKHNLAASVVQFKGVDFTEKTDKERQEFFNQMSEVLLRLLAGKLSKFEQLVADVLLDEGAIANF